MEQKDFDGKLNEYADKISNAVSEGVKRLEKAFETERDKMRATENAPEGTRATARSPRFGIVLVTIGILWLLYTLGVFAQPVLPILLIIAGVYFIAKSR
jgi:hypothetical protein